MQPNVSQQVSINKLCPRFLQVFTVPFLPVSFENHSSVPQSKASSFTDAFGATSAFDWGCVLVKTYLILGNEQDFPLKMIFISG